MTKSLKFIKLVSLALFSAVAAGLAYLFTAFPAVGSAPPTLKVEATPARLARGKYLAENVAGCIDCHSTRDFSRFSGPVAAGTEGKGGMRFEPAMLPGLPGTLVAPNITPAALSAWTDGELLRAITEGVSRDGRALFPLMPYPGFANLSQEDAYSIIAYIRSLAPVENTTEKSVLEFPVNLIVRTMPKPAQLAASVPTEPVARGRCLVNVAGCADCHTPAEKGAPIAGLEFAGGMEFRFPDGSVLHSANITPDADTGIGAWSREDFVKRFKSASAVPVQKGGFNTVMPWSLLSGMTEEDLSAIYAYLRTVSPVKHSVTKFTPARDVVAEGAEK